MNRDFHELTSSACADEALRDKLRAATNRQRDGRVAICRELGDVEKFRDLAARLRDEILSDLDGFLACFAERVEARGVHVHWAADAAAAREAVLETAAAAGVTSVVKSKSMLTEEIGLNAAIEGEGIEVVETDLGEFIIQLLGQAPSHIVMPAIHLSAGEVNALFREKISYRGPPDAASLTMAARHHLRGKFARAGMGISGVNFAIAKEGLWTICTNEGNGRYVAGLPPLYVAVMGIERIVQDAASAAVILKLLGRFATGQRITQYLNLAGGPCRHDGPESVHLVIVDNGRTRILGSPYRSMLRCIRCGACLNVCPVFRTVGGQSFPGCYSGPMGSVLLPLQKGFDEAGATPKACSLCGICAEVCPVKIPLPDLLLELRADLVAERRGSVPERVGMRLAAGVLQSPLLYRAAQATARCVLGPLSRSGWVDSLPSIPGEWTKTKDFPVPAKESFFSVEAGRKKGRRSSG
jgi:L-lactate dehydrogenase complex protein LldF